MSNVQAAAFDCDGLLVDTSTHWADAFRAAARLYGIALDAAHLADLAGTAIEPASRHIAALSGTDVSEPIAESIHHQLMSELRDRPPLPLPGAVDVVAAVSQRVAVAVVSNAPSDAVTLSLSAIGLSDAFDVVVSAHPGLCPKPAPDPYLQACAALGVPPDRTVGFEDSIIGAQSACTAGLRVVAVTANPWPDSTDLPLALHVPALDNPRLLARIVGHVKDIRDDLLNPPALRLAQRATPYLESRHLAE